MSQSLAAPSTPFTDRRNYDASVEQPDRERRQFANSHDELSPEAKELAGAIDEYKLATAAASSRTKKC